MAKRPALRVGTIGNLVRQGRTIWLDCLSCHRSVERPPAAIAASHGAELPLQRFLERAVCRCGTRFPDVEMIAPPASQGGFPV